MVSAFVMSTQADRKKEVQSIIEGDNLTTPGTYGVIPANPNFTAVGPDGGTLVVKYEPSRTIRRKAGNLDRNGKTTNKKKYTATLTFKASDNNLALQKWCINKSAITDTDTPAASRAFLHSYTVGGTETYEVVTGCHPTKCTITLNAEGEISYSVELMCRNREQSQLTDATDIFTLGTGSFASADTAAPWVSSDGGVNHFTFKAVNYAIESMTIDITHEYAMADPTESQLILFAQEGLRDVSGSVTIIKSGVVVSDTAFADELNSMSIVLKSGQLTLSFVDTIFESPQGVEIDPNSADKFVDDYAYEASSVTAA